MSLDLLRIKIDAFFDHHDGYPSMPNNSKEYVARSRSVRARLIELENRMTQSKRTAQCEAHPYLSKCK